MEDPATAGNADIVTALLLAVVMPETRDSPRLRAPKRQTYGDRHAVRSILEAGDLRVRCPTQPLLANGHTSTNGAQRDSAYQVTVSLIRLLIVVKGWAPQASRFFSRRRCAGFFSEIAERPRTSCGF